MGIGKKFQFSKKLSFILEVGTRYTHGYCGSLMGKSYVPIDQCQLQWP